MNPSAPRWAATGAPSPRCPPSTWRRPPSTELVRRTGLQEGDVDDVVLGQLLPQRREPGHRSHRRPRRGPRHRRARPPARPPLRLRPAGRPVRRGAGRQRARARVVVAGGAESMSNVEHYALGLRTGVRSGGVELMDRLVRARETAGGATTRCRAGCSRPRRTCAASTTSPARSRTSSRSAPSSGPAPPTRPAGSPTSSCRSPSPGRRGKPDVVVDRDEHPRPDTTLEQLAALRPVRQKVDAASTVTAGNASGQNDGAAMCVVTTREEAERRGLRPLLALRSWAVAGVGPEVMGIGPVPATAAALERAGLTLDEIDVIELNEAFAAQVLAVPARVEGRPDRRAAQPQRLRHLARPPGRRHRRAHPGHDGPRDAAPGVPLRPRDHVHRRRPGPRRGLRAGHLMNHPSRMLASLRFDQGPRT